MQRGNSGSPNRSHAAKLGRCAINRWLMFICLCLAMILVDCGGGGSNGQTSSPPPASFTIVATPSTPSIAPGTSSTFQVSVTPTNGFSGTVAITISGLPTGLSAAPSSFSLQNAAQSVTLTADATIKNGSYPLTITGTSGSLTNSSKVSIGVGALANFVIIQPFFSQVVARFGSSTQIQLATESQGLGMSNYLLSFGVIGLPPGVTASFSPNVIPVGATTTLTITASTAAQWIQGTLFNVVATPSAPVPSNALTLDFVLAPPPGNIPNNQTSYLRTDETPRSIVYDAAHQQIFSSDYFLDRVDVVSATTRQLVKSIPVLSPAGLALTINGQEILVGSDTQQVQAISTTSLQVVKKWLLAPISGTAYGIETPIPLANGTVAFRPSGYGILSGELGIWNPTTNTSSLIHMPAALGDIACFVAAGPKSTVVLIASCSSPGVALLYDTAAKTFSTPLHFSGFIWGLASSPDGSQFIISDEVLGIQLYNSQLQSTALLAYPDFYSSFIYSGDGSRIYLQVGIIGVFDSSGNFIREAPTLGTIPPGATLVVPCPAVETPLAVDSTGIIFGAADHGIAFDDSTYSVGTIFGYGGGFPCAALTLTPSFGTVNAATPTAFPQGYGFGSVPDVWFGPLRAQQASLSLGLGNLSAIAPASSQAGPVDVKLISADGEESYNPLDFSYGPSLMFVNGNAAAPAGGTMAFVTGLGLPTDPNQIQLTVGSQNASVVSAKKAFYFNNAFPNAYPYPAVELQVTLPPGSGDQDLVVTTSSGKSTLAKAIHYVQTAKDYPSPDTFQSILLDRTRNQLYLSAGDHIDVFSLTSSQFLTAFKPPSLNGQADFHGLALTPDHSLLLAANFPDGSLALINPDQPSSATAVQIIPAGTNPGIENVVATNTGLAFIESKTTQSIGCGGPIYELTLASLQVTPISNIPFCIQPEGFPMAASIDGSTVVLTTTDISGDQNIAIYNASSKKWVRSLSPENFGGNAAVSANGGSIDSGGRLLDSNGSVLGSLAWQDVFQSPGQSFSLPLEKIPDGESLVYMPRGSSSTRPSCVDIYDINQGTLLRRLNLTEEIQQVTDSMAVDAYGENIFLITKAGLMIVQLPAAPLSIGKVSPNPAAVGAKITIYGSGFQPGTIVKIAGTSVTPTVVDPNTLQATVPSVTSGAAQVTVSNSSGDTYTLDNALVVQ